MQTIKFQYLRRPKKSPKLRPLWVKRCGSQVVRPSSAKALSGGSIPPRTSTHSPLCHMRLAKSSPAGL